MHTLTITTDNTTNTTTCHDLDDALRTLVAEAIKQNLHLHPSEPTGRHNTTFTLIRPDRAVRVIGTATIAAAANKPVAAPYYSAVAALRWTADHTSTWQCGSENDPGVRYPLAVLTAARAEARHWFTAGTLYPEAASLSDAGRAAVTRPSQHAFERLRHNAIHTARTDARITPAELATAVVTQLTPDITAEQTAALIWYYALIQWGASAP
ncbi:hypothetical protein ACQ86B_28450 (plasmid) [Mycolicibacterium aichiense]|uniref:hypothetical protein n=1 Tax=Mycolicibacterium aichiense TaxID=1799 RepID=UPI003D6702FA